MNLHRSILPFAVVALFVACSQQGEGERCVRTNGNADCGSGLVCWAAGDLVEYDTSKEFAADRCCPADKSTFSDPRCAKSSKDTNATTKPGTGGAASSASVGSAGATAAAQAGGGSSSDGAGGENAGTAGALDETAGSAGSGA